MHATARDALATTPERRSEDEQGSADEEADQALMDLVWDALKVSTRQSVNRREETLRRALRHRRVPDEVRTLPKDFREAARMCRELGSNEEMARGLEKAAGQAQRTIQRAEGDDRG